MERTKMPASERAKQFMPFDALKGLQDALRLKEYKHEKIQMGDLSEDEVIEISNILSKIKKGDVVEAEYFEDGYLQKISGAAKMYPETQEILIGDKMLNFNSLKKIKFKT